MHQSPRHRNRQTAISTLKAITNHTIDIPADEADRPVEEGLREKTEAEESFCAIHKDQFEPVAAERMVDRVVRGITWRTRSGRAGLLCTTRPETI